MASSRVNPKKLVGCNRTRRTTWTTKIHARPDKGRARRRQKLSIVAKSNTGGTHPPETRGYPIDDVLNSTPCLPNPQGGVSKCIHMGLLISTTGAIGKIFCLVA